MARDDYGYTDESGRFVKFSQRPRAIGSESAMRIIWEAAGGKPTTTLSGEPYLLEDVKLRADHENYILSAELSDYMDRRASCGIIGT